MSKRVTKADVVYDFANFNITYSHYKEDPEVNKLYKLFDDTATRIVSWSTNPIGIKESNAANAYIDYRKAAAQAQHIVSSIREREKKRTKELRDQWTKTLNPVNLSDAMTAIEYMREADRETQINAIGVTENRELRAMIQKARNTLGDAILGDDLLEAYETAFFEAHKDELSLLKGAAAATDDLLLSFEDGLQKLFQYHCGYDTSYAKELADNMYRKIEETLNGQPATKETPETTDNETKEAASGTAEA